MSGNEIEKYVPVVVNGLPIPDEKTPERLGRFWEKHPDFLTQRQERFVDAMVGPAMGNVTKAIKMAGYKMKHHWSSSAIAAKLMSKPEVRRAIAERSQAFTLGPEQTAEMLSRMATFDPGDFGDECYRFEHGRRVVNWEYLRQNGLSQFVSVVKASGKQGHEMIQWHDRMEALTLLARIHGMTRDRMQVEVVDIRRASEEELERLANS